MWTVFTSGWKLLCLAALSPRVGQDFLTGFFCLFWVLSRFFDKNAFQFIDYEVFLGAVNG